ncbi:sigma-54 dependent transcriptional regulator [Kiloniella sp. EL199]|uniref:sigma-54-dependent transcriptional regulator n=1 Tax=Kiloniella sp. EL199 TaxID=2107581 RepID=UPI000EA2805C|nr:sigma-54 dependent transcriptional regulator [Kiloniella sp. EL199]
MASLAKKEKILLIEDALPMARIYMEYMANEPYDITHVDTGKKAFAAIKESVPDAIILDMKLPDMDGMEILGYLQENAIPSSVVVITANASISVAVQAMQAGASDFIVKPFNADRLIYTLRNALEHQDLVKIVGSLKQKYSKGNYCRFIGSSMAMKAVYQTIDNAATSKASVFITGASGTGKELCAEALHSQSPRQKAKFIALNCAAIPKDLMESEIFGHVKGAFTGAAQEREGAAKLADGGTLFLDEICEMDIQLQAKILRLIQSGTFQKVGSSDEEKVDIRFVCATNRVPWEEVQAGRFREDLYYRLHVIPIHLPSLYERDGDALEIAKSFLKNFTEEEGKAFKGFSPEVEKYIGDYSWPGNVRELQNVVRNAIVLNDGEELTLDMLPQSPGLQGTTPPHVTGIAPSSPQPIPSAQPEHSNITPIPSPMQENSSSVGTINTEIRPMWMIETEMIIAALEQTDGSVPKASALLEISASTIYRRLKEKKEAEKQEAQQ